MNRTLKIALIAALLALPVTLASADLPDEESASEATSYIATTQEADGGFGGFGPGQTVDAVLAFRAAGIDPATVTADGNFPADFLAANAEELAESPGSAGKAALAAVALGLESTDVGGVDFIDAVESPYDAESGRYAEDAFNQSLAVLGMACTGSDVPDEALAALADDQLDDGGWGFEGESDPDTAALAIQSLVAAGEDASSDAVAAGLSYLQESQNGDAGWGTEEDTSNASSTAYAIQALIAAGEDPDGDTYMVDGASPADYLLGIQEDDGSFPGFDPIYATIQVVPALTGLTYCEAAEAPADETVEPQDTGESDGTAAGDESGASTPPATGTGQAAGTGNTHWTLAALGLAALVLGGAGLRVTRK